MTWTVARLPAGRWVIGVPDDPDAEIFEVNADHERQAIYRACQRRSTQRKDAVGKDVSLNHVRGKMRHAVKRHGANLCRAVAVDDLEYLRLAEHEEEIFIEELERLRARLLREAES